MEGDKESEDIPLQTIDGSLVANGCHPALEPSSGDLDGSNEEGFWGHGVKNHWRDISATVCLASALFMCNIAYSIIGPFLPKEVERVGDGGPLVTGVIISCSPLCVVIFSPIFGYLLPYVGFRYMISTGLLLIGSSFVLLGFADLLPSNWIFVVYCVFLRMTEGVGTSMFVTATFTVIPLLFPKSVATVTGLFEVAGGVGYALGFPLGGLLYHYGGFMLPFFSVGALVLVFILPCTLLVRKYSATRKHFVSCEVIRLCFCDLVFVLLVLLVILATASFSHFTPILQPFLYQQFDLNPFGVGLVFFAAPLTYVSLSFFVGPLSDRLGHRWFVCSGAVLFGVALIFVGPVEFIGTPRLWLTSLAFAAIGVSSALLVPVYADMLASAKKLLKGSDDSDVTMVTAFVSGILSSSLSLGKFLGALTGGALAEVLSFQTISFLFGEFLLAEAFSLVGVTLIQKCTAVEHRKRRED